MRLATDPVYVADNSEKLGKDLWWGPWVRTDQTLNMPPQIIDGKLRVLGNLLIDPADPRQRVIGGNGYTP